MALLKMDTAGTLRADGLEKNNFLKGHPRAAWGIGTDEQMFKNKKWRY